MNQRFLAELGSCQERPRGCCPRLYSLHESKACQKKIRRSRSRFLRLLDVTQFLNLGKLCEARSLPAFHIVGVPAGPRVLSRGERVGQPSRAGARRGVVSSGTWGSRAARPRGARPCAAAPRSAASAGRDRVLPPPRRYDVDSCTYYFSWDSRAACAVRPQEVQMANGTIINPVSGRSVSLGDVYFK